MTPRWPGERLPSWLTLNVDVDPDARVADLSLAQRQMVEIVRAVSRDADVLIMDEPTSALSEREVAKLFSIVADLRARGKAVIYITHKIDEVFLIADEVTVMRDGRVVGNRCRRASWIVIGSSR